MPGKKQLVNGALLGAAAAALTVKSALAGPLGAAAEAPAHQLQKKLGSQANEALDASRALVDRAQTGIAVAIAQTAGGDTRLEGPGTSNRQHATNPPRTAVSSTRASDAAGRAIDARAERADSQARMRDILRSAALRHGLDPKLVLALSYWESGWDQSRVSSNGAVGLMQVEPYAAQDAGPALLGRPVDITNPVDNADVGAAIFREDLDNFGSPAAALAAYYQGPESLKENGMFPDTVQYVNGILALASQMNAG